MAKDAHGGNKQSERQCAVTRLRRAPGELLRFALDPDGNAVPDLKARLPGRGVWVTCARDVLEKAVAGRVFDRAFRGPVKASEQLASQVDALLERDALQRLSLASKAGMVACGFDQVSKALKKGVGVLVHASDAAGDGCRKLDRLAHPGKNGAQPAPAIVRSFDAGQLSLALGRPNVVHASLKRGGPSEHFLKATARLERFRAGSAVYAAA